MARQAGIENEGCLTNTSRPKTAVQRFRRFFDQTEISELTGHADTSSIQSYSHNVFQTQDRPQMSKMQSNSVQHFQLFNA